MQSCNKKKKVQGMIDSRIQKNISYDNLSFKSSDSCGYETKLSRRDFRKIAPNGFGDGYNSYPHSMTWFKNHLYLGITRATLIARGYHRSVYYPETIGEIWPVRIPKNLHSEVDLGAQIWQYNPSSGILNRVYVSPRVKGKDGFDVPVSVSFRAMTLFQGKSDEQQAMYVPTFATFQRPETQMLRSTDGINFDFVSEPGLGLPNPPRALRAFVPFNGRLFMSPSMGQKQWQHNIADEMIILDSPDPANGGWRVSCEPYFGNKNNITVFHMAVFKDHLYAGTMNVNEGFQVWKTDAEGNPPYKWKKILTHGAYRGKFNQGVATLCPFKDHLYVGTGVQYGGFDIENNIGPVQMELIRIGEDDSWDLVAGEPRRTPEGFKTPLSGKGPGFGDPFAGYAWSMCEHDGWLYLGTECWGTFLRYTSMGDQWPEWLKKMFDSKKIGKIVQNFGGCDIWRSKDGIRWEPVSLNGFGNCFNFGVRSMASTPYGLFIGFANGFGPEVAVKRATGWNFENNSNGGMEIWLGSKDMSHGSLSCFNKNKNMDFDIQPDMLNGLGQFSETDYLKRLNEEPLRNKDAYTTLLPHGQILSGKASQTEKSVVDQILDHFFCNSMFRHIGFWSENIDNARAACENLMDEVMALVPEKKGNIVDIGCGLGATTHYLSRYFPSSSVTGITNDIRSLDLCKLHHSGISYFYHKLPRLKVTGKCFDVAVYVKGFSRLGNRKKLLKSCHSILKPYGQFVCFDLIDHSRLNTNILRKIGIKSTSKTLIDMYKDMLHDIGFGDLKAIDVTQQCIDGFIKHVTEYFQFKRLSQDLKSDSLYQAEMYLKKQVKHGTCCLLVSGIRHNNQIESNL